VIRGDSLEKNSIFRFREKGRIPLARVKRLGISLKLDASIIVLLRIVPWRWVEPLPRRGTLVGSFPLLGQRISLAW
jgi:hypothetical protein